MSHRFSASQMLKPTGLALIVAIAAASYLGCKKDEPPPPMPSAAPAPTPTPTAALVLEPEDAGIIDAGEDAAPKKATGGGGSSLKACCAALRQNAKSAPPPNNQYMELAAAACESGAGLPVIQSTLRGVGLPAGCK